MPAILQQFFQIWARRAQICPTQEFHKGLPARCTMSARWFDISNANKEVKLCGYRWLQYISCSDLSCTFTESFLPGCVLHSMKLVRVHRCLAKSIERKLASKCNSLATRPGNPKIFQNQLVTYPTESILQAHHGLKTFLQPIDSAMSLQSLPQYKLRKVKMPIL